MRILKKSALLIYLAILFTCRGYSQEKSYTIALWGQYNNLLFQKVLQINYDSIKPLLNSLVSTFDAKLVSEDEKHPSGGAIINSMENNHPDTLSDADIDHLYYAYIGDTTIKKTIKIDILHFNKYLASSFVYTFLDSEFTQKVMVDSLFSGKWIQYDVYKGHLSIYCAKTIKNYRVDGALFKYNDDGSFSSISVYDKGVLAEGYYMYGDSTHENILTSIRIPSPYLSKRIHIDFQNGKIKDIMKYDSKNYNRYEANSAPYLIFDANGKVIGGIATI